MAGDSQFFLNTLKDKIQRGAATVKQKAMVEYYEHTRGGKSSSGDWFSSRFFQLPFSYSRMNDWVHFRQAEHEVELARRQQTEITRRNNFFGPRFMYDVEKGYTGTLDDWKRAHIKNINREGFELAQWNPTPGKGYFPLSSQEGVNSSRFLRPQVRMPPQLGGGLRQFPGDLPRQFTALDIETDDYGRPIAISALKMQYDPTTKKFVRIADFQRFYESRNSDLMQTVGVHGLDAGTLHKLRKQQFRGGIAQYSRHYGDIEANALKEFLGNSTIVGHNIVDFDLPHLFSTPLDNQTIDTLTASRNQWSGKSNTLDTVFKRLYGKSMEQMGLSHHDSMSDVIASVLILQKMALMEGNTGDALRYVMMTPGTQIAPLDAMLNSQVMRGKYSEYQNIGRYLDMKKYDKTPLGEITNRSMLGGEYNEDTDKYELPEGFSEVGPGTEDALAGEVLNDLESSAISDIKDIVSTLNEATKHTESASHINNSFADKLSETVSAFNFSDMRNFRLKIAHIDDEKERARFVRAAGYGDNEARNILSGTARLNAFYKAQEQDKFAYVKERKIAHMERHGRLLDENDKDKLMATENMDEFVDVADEVNLKMQKIVGSFKAFSSIPLYNFERLESAFKGEVSGVMGAARGLVPDFIYSPVSRLVSAGLNSFNYANAPLKGAWHATQAIGGGLMGAGGALMASGVGVAPGIGLMAAGGLTSLVSQIWGNAKESQIIRRGEDIQNNLNSIGFVQDMALMPFRLLAVAINKAIKGLNMFASIIRSVSGLMSNNLTGLTQMGNPLTGMTGVNFGNYVGSTSADYASLLGKGTVNGIYNDFATQRMKLYTTGAVDTNRLVAASMLGIFDQTYGTAANEEGAFSSAIDYLYQSIKTQTDLEKKQTYVLANMVSPHVASILQSMETLGVRGFDDLKHPAGMWGYSEDSIEAYRKRFQRAQWEYQYAGSQKDITMQRIGTTLWNGSKGTFGVSGKSIYNEFNKFISSVASSLESGNWDTAAADIKTLWDTLTKGFEGLWASVKKVFGIDEEATFGDTLLKGIGDIGIKAITYLRQNVLPKFLDIWDIFVDYAIDKATGLMEFLSTIRVDWGALFQQLTTGKSDKPIITSLLDVHASQQVEDKGSTKALSLTIPMRNFLSTANEWGEKSGFGRVATSREYFMRARHGWDMPLMDSTYADMESWLDKLLTSGDDGKINRFHDALQIKMGRELPSFQGKSGKDILDNLVRVYYNPNATNFISPGWGMEDDLESSSIRGTLKTLQQSSVPLRNALINGVLDTASETLVAVQDPALLVVRFNDDKKDKAVEAEVHKSGKISFTKYNNFVDVSAKDGMFQFQMNQSTRVAGY